MSLSSSPSPLSITTTIITIKITIIIIITITTITIIVIITITHHRATMEEADVLYGVTMQEKGVTTVLAMDLEEAEKTIQNRSAGF